MALQVAAELVEEYADGVWLVELAALTDPALVPQTVAAALGVREQPGRPLTETLSDYLRGKSLLLLLDNCEHLPAACAHLAESQLRSCPNLRILASSREGLGIAGETAYRVPSLSMPGLQRLSSVEALTQFEAVRLFVERAGAALPSFALNDGNAPAVASVCQRLDGIPLAIELAAARVKALPVEKIAERLDDRFRLLTGAGGAASWPRSGQRRGPVPGRAALPRQQTLRALIDWSYDLLSEAERALLRRLSVFAGGWTLEAAEVVCAHPVASSQPPVVSGDEGLPSLPTAYCLLPTDDVLELLTQLVDRSLVQYEEPDTREAGGGEARYRLLETVRQYGRDRLLESGEAEGIRWQHARLFLALAEERGDPGLAVRAELAREHDNLRAALAWSSAHRQWEAGLRLCGALGWFWWVRGHWTEVREHLAGLLALPGAEARTAARAKALRCAGKLAMAQGYSGAARALHEESLAIRRELGDKGGIADSLNNLGAVAWEQGEYGAARALHGESLAIRRELGDKRGIALLLRHLGWTAYAQGDYGTARALYEDSLAIFRELGDKPGIADALGGLGFAARDQEDSGAARALLEESLAFHRELADKPGIAYSLWYLGWVARDQGEYEAARVLQEESLAIFRELGDKPGIAYSLVGLGQVARDQGDSGAARALYEESLAICQELGDKRAIPANLEGLAAVAVAQAQPERGARLFGAAEAMREAVGRPLPPADRAEHDCAVAAARAALGEEAFAAAWEAGRALSLDEAVALALDETRELTGAACFTETDAPAGSRLRGSSG